MVKDHSDSEKWERERNVLFNDAINTFYLRLYGVRHMVKDHSDSEKGEREREMFYLMTHSTHFIYSYMASDIWLRIILIVRKETRCRHIGYSFRLAARVLLYAPSHRQDSTYHGLCYTSRGALAGTRNSSMGPPHEGSIRRPIDHERTLYLWAMSRSPSQKRCNQPQSLFFISFIFQASNRSQRFYNKNILCKNKL